MGEKKFFVSLDTTEEGKRIPFAVIDPEVPGPDLEEAEKMLEGFIHPPDAGRTTAPQHYPGFKEQHGVGPAGRLCPTKTLS